MELRLPRRARIVLGAVLLVGLTAFTSPVESQEKPREWTREELISAAREIMIATRYCVLITTDSSGRNHARAMDAFAPDEKLIVWFGTNPRSRKATDIRKNPKVTLYYFDRENQAYVTIYGVARLVSDALEKTRHWKDEWTAFYPNRARDYLLIEVRPKRLEVVNTKKGLVGDPRTWQPPTITFGNR